MSLAIRNGLIPYNLARRLCTIMSDKNLLNYRLSQLRYLPQQRGYHKSLVENGIKKATSHDRNGLLSTDKN